MSTNINMIMGTYFILKVKISEDRYVRGTKIMERGQNFVFKGRKLKFDIDKQQHKTSIQESININEYSKFVWAMPKLHFRAFT